MPHLLQNSPKNTPVDDLNDATIEHLETMGHSILHKAAVMRAQKHFEYLRNRMTVDQVNLIMIENQ